MPPAALVVVGELVVVFDVFELDPPPQPASASAATATSPTRTGRVPIISSSSSGSSDDTRTCSDPEPSTVTGIEVTRIAPGLWRWTAYHEEWRQDVGCVYHETPDGVVLVDPLVPGDGETRFWEALDRDVENAGGMVHVLVTVFWHTRSAAAMVERYSALVWAPARGQRAVARRAGKVTDAFGADDRLPGGIVAYATAKANEVVYWLPGERSLVPGDVLLGDGRGGIRLCPESWLPERVGHAELAASLRPLPELPVERVLLSHGEPVLESGLSALEAALGAAMEPR